jgi:hypothetical protein
VNRRGYFRIRMRPLDARATHVSGGRARSLTVRVLDLSGSGAQLLTSEPMRPGDLLRLHLPPGRGRLPLWADARVTRMQRHESSWDIGVEFLHLSETVRDSLVALVFREEQRRRLRERRTSGPLPPVRTRDP